MLPLFILYTSEVPFSPSFPSLFHTEPSLVNRLTESLRTSLPPACSISTIDYPGLFFASCLLDLSATCFLVGNVMTGTTKKHVIK